jgi:hypothetical protein
MQHGGDVEPTLCGPIVGNRHRDDNHDACVLHNPVSQKMPLRFFWLILTDFFLLLFNGL